MMSYIFCLEYILKKMHRHDMLPYISQIKCPKRRRDYEFRMIEIFGSESQSVIERLFRREE